MHVIENVKEIVISSKGFRMYSDIGSRKTFVVEALTYTCNYYKTEFLFVLCCILKIVKSLSTLKVNNMIIS